MNTHTPPLATLDHNYFTNEHKILIFYILNKIPEIEIRKIIWVKIIEYEEEEINKLITQAWYDDINIVLQELAQDERIDYQDLFNDLLPFNLII
ncbi:hypothetical protein L3H37_10895 [Corynebacterium sp. MC-20]|uniref:hypothetical protein n=1 Tax=Corynebacterium parakroppenstedtii TaxID=2828363 RepID=UPI001F4287DF|nr:hypothetical protein [Corynebacterium parakroppenstedtii]MCF6821070.1 hypothetical protein [Corynebacterium parakroppenstedtii]